MGSCLLLIDKARAKDKTYICDLDMMGDPSKLSVIRKAATLARARPTLLFELDRESRAAVVEHATLCLRKLNS